MNSIRKFKCYKILEAKTLKSCWLFRLLVLHLSNVWEKQIPNTIPMTDLDYKPESIEDVAVSSALDQELRDLLSLCFTQPHDTMFRHRRFNKAPPARRWLFRSPDGFLTAHVACHDKMVIASGEPLLTAGLSEVCTHPDHRRRGLARQLITLCEAWASTHGYRCCSLRSMGIHTRI